MERKKKTLMLFPLILSLLILPEIVTADSRSSSTHPGPITSESYPAAYYGSTPYQSIQDAINHAPRNGTIIITPGIYTEILTINKSLTLTGDTPETTLLVPSSAENSCAIKIISEGVILANLSLCNTAPGLYTTGIKIMNAHTTITHCIIRDTPIGIAIWTSQNTISSCKFQGCDDEGIVLLGTSTKASSNNTITTCTFSDNCDGIELQYATNNLITSCSFTRNSHAGIDAIGSNNTNNIISQCTFTENQVFGLYFAKSSYNQLLQCTFSNDTIMFVHASNNILRKSQIGRIHLFDNSSLLVDQCSDIKIADLISQQSSFEIRTDQSFLEKKSQGIIYHPFIHSLLTRLKTLKLLYQSQM